MNNYKVELSGEAQDGLAEIYHYIRDELCNHDAAERFLNDTENAISSLENFPHSHMVRPGSKKVGTYEKHQYFFRENYCLFYVILEECKTVRVIKVTYSRRDLDKE